MCDYAFIALLLPLKFKLIQNLKNISIIKSYTRHFFDNLLLRGWFHKKIHAGGGVPTHSFGARKLKLGM